ncbi:hypothetical protein ACOSQ3_003393 [Xanthoceras sorbifolium]
MGISVLIGLLLAFVICEFSLAIAVSFNDNYIIRYGSDHVSYLNQGQAVQLSLDLSSGAGFGSKLGYGSGFFQMKIKLPTQHSPGVVTTFYLTSSPDNQPGNHDELDFEFLGSDGPPYTLQTNIFAGDNGGREQRIHLWFDPTAAFHDYAILWNDHQIVFFVDNIPIRVYKNNKNLGARYPKQEMFVEGSLWNGESWASNGRKVDWSKAPFQALYQGFDINGCHFGSKCSNSWWSNREYWQLNPKQQTEYENIRKKFVFYDYCSIDKTNAFKECHIP